MFLPLDGFQFIFCYVTVKNDLSIACHSPGKWTSSVKQWSSELKLQNFTTQSNDADVFTGVDLERRNLLYKYRSFWIWEMKIRFLVFLRNDVFHCLFIRSRTSSDQSRPRQPRGSRAFCLSPRTINERFRNWNCCLCMLIDSEVYSIVTYSLSEN